MVVTLFIVLIIVGVIVCRRVNHDNRDDSNKTLDPRASLASMDYNHAYPSPRDLSKLQSTRTQRDFSNSFYASDVIMDSEPIYDDLVF